ncbi:MAG TPA: MFS transporter [Bacillota bacterium]|nr:MFS transporter [Bacillota bacterium]
MKKNKSAVLLFALCWCAYAVSYVGRLNFSSCLSPMAQDGIFTSEYGGAVGTAFLACYGCGQLLSGFLGDRIKPEYMIFTGLAGSGCANILMACVNNGTQAIFIWGLNGLFCSMLWAPLVRCFADYMDSGDRMRAGINISTTIPVGTICAYLLCSLLLNFASWRTVFAVSGAAVLLCSAVWLAGMLSIRKYCRAVSYENIRQRQAFSEKSAASGNKKSGFFKLFITYGVIFTAVAILFNGVLKDGITVWIPTFLKNTFGVSASFAAAISIILPIVNLLGAYGANLLNRRVIKNEMATSGVMFAISLMSILTLYFAGHSSIVLSAFLLALSTSSMLGANTMFLTFIPLSFGAFGRSASMTGFLDACSYIASAVSSLLIGITAVRFGWNVTVLIWGAVALCGGAICAAGMGKWKKSREILQS